MIELFADYSISKELELLGFNESCLATIDNYGAFHIKGKRKPPQACVASIDEIKCPLKYQIFQWFRDKYGIHGEVNSQYFRYNTYDIEGQFEDEICYWKYNYKISWVGETGSKDYIRVTIDFEKVNHYEEYGEAELACIKQILKIIRTNNESITTN